MSHAVPATYRAVILTKKGGVEVLRTVELPVEHQVHGTRLRGQRGAFHGVTALYRMDPKPLREDLPKVFAVLAERRSTRSSPAHSRAFKLDKRSSSWRRVPWRAKSFS
jgi:hypothetical protein